jgi:ADP-heptose:LPS heptosyltransferase
LKKDSLVIYTDSSKDGLGLGNYLRIISILPNLGFKNFIWISDENVHYLIYNCQIIQKVSTINSEESLKILEQADCILNLFENISNYKNTIFLKDLLDVNLNVKQNTLDLCEIIAKKFQKPEYNIYSNNEKYNNNIDIFINNIVPEEWSIKSYPLQKIKNIVDKIKIVKPDLIIEWQNKNDSIVEYIGKIKNSRIIITIIGLGTHLGMLFNKDLIVLSGPTYFNEIDLYKKKKIILPKNFCEWRPCNLPTGVNNCGCMGDIDEQLIFSELRELI